MKPSSTPPPTSIRAFFLENALVILPLAMLGQLCFLTPQSSERLFSVEWIPALGVNLDFKIDGLSLLFCGLICGVGSLVVFYSTAYFRPDQNRVRLYIWLFLFLFSMLGLVLANNLILLFLFWELTSLTSYMLIGYKHKDEKARFAARQALLVTGFGGLCLLAGLIMLGSLAGTYLISDLVSQGTEVLNHPRLPAAICLILLGVLTKSAQFPFHFWLPGAMAAPTPISAYLHSATMVKAGIYLVARLQRLLGTEILWQYSLIFLGLIIALVCAFIALWQTDLKRIMAFSTVSSLGVIITLLGIGTPLAISASMTYLLCHACYKGGLFLVAGAVDFSTGTRDIRELRGLGKALPILALGGMFLGLSQAGIPPFGGFLAKEMLYDAARHTPVNAIVLLLGLVAVNVATCVATCYVSVIPFFGPATRPESITPLPMRLVIPPVVLGVIGLLIGLAPGVFANSLVHPAVLAIAPGSDLIPLKLWHGWNLPLLLSGVTLAAGVALFLSRERWLAYRFLTFRWRFEAGYRWLLSSLDRIARWQTRTLQSGRLSNYLLVVVVTLISIVVWKLSLLGWTFELEWPGGLQFYEWFIPVLILAAIVMVIFSESRLAAVCGLGVIGYAMAMLFVIYGAPDLAMTQLAIETLTVIVYVLVIYRLPKFSIKSTFKVGLRDAAVVLMAGCVVTMLALSSMQTSHGTFLSDYFGEKSWKEAQGRNVVNVILVDFRSLDTLGEVTVLATAALGIFALMRAGRIDHEKTTPKVQDTLSHSSSIELQEVPPQEVRSDS